MEPGIASAVAGALREHLAPRYLPAWPRTLEARRTHTLSLSLPLPLTLSDALTLTRTRTLTRTLTLTLSRRVGPSSTPSAPQHTPRAPIS